jgi:hypothetical protein
MAPYTSEVPLRDIDWNGLHIKEVAAAYDQRLINNPEK